MRKQARALIAALVLAVAPPLAAQPMMGGGMGGPMGGGSMGGPGGPDLRSIVGKPLPAGELPVGTVTVRVARKMPANAVAGVEVTGVVTQAGGDSRKRTAKTDAGGRATFDGLPAGSSLRAEVTVDGELLQSDELPLPARGGLRTMLISGLGGGQGAAAEAGAGSAGPAREAGGGGEAPDGDFPMPAATGAGVPDLNVPAKTVDVHVLGEDGRPVPGREVMLAEAGTEAGLQVRKATTDASGVARFSGLAGGERTGYAAAVQHEGMRLGTEPFHIADGSGVRAEIHLTARTADTSSLRLAQGSKILVTLREGALEIVEVLRFENAGARIIDPGPAGIDVPLPVGAVNAQGFDGENVIEPVKDHGVRAHVSVPPGGTVVQFAFILPFTGRTLTMEQPMPYGLAALSLVTERGGDLSVDGPGVRQRDEREGGGKPLWLVSGDGVDRGGTLSLTFRGLPGPDPTERNLAGIVALLIGAATVAFARRPGGSDGGHASERARLEQRREKLFGELVALERRKRAGGGDDGGERHRDLVGKLETVYRELAALEEA